MEYYAKQFMYVHCIKITYMKQIVNLKTLFKECTLNEKYRINNTYVPVIIIKRILKVEKSLKTPAIETTTVLTRLGYILKHTWGKTMSEELKIKKSMRVSKNGFVFHDTLLYLKEYWDQDIRLKSMFLDKVVSITKIEPGVDSEVLIG